MKRVLYLSIFILSLLPIVFYTGAFFINYETLYGGISVGSDLKINSADLKNARIKKFPFPSAYFDKMDIKGYAELKGVRFDMDFLSILFFKPKIKSLNIREAYAPLKEGGGTLLDYSAYLYSLFPLSKNFAEIYIGELVFLDSRKNSADKIMEVKIKNSSGGLKSFSCRTSDLGSFVFSETKDSVSFDFGSDDYSLSMEGKKAEELSFTGKGSLKILDPVAFTSRVDSDAAFLIKDFNDGEQIYIDFDLSYGQGAADGKISKIYSSSEGIEGSGTFSLGQKTSEPGSVNLDFSKIDLNLLFKKDAQKKSSKYFSGTPIKIGEGNFSLKINIEKLIYGNENFSKIFFNSLISDSETHIEGLEGLIDSGGSFALSGNITSDSYKTTLEGEFRAEHPDLSSMLRLFGYGNLAIEEKTPFSCYSKIKIGSVDSYFKDFTLKTDDAKVSGNISAKFIGATPRFSALLDVSSINLDKKNYPVLSPIISFCLGLTENTKDMDYPKKFIPVRTVGYLGDFFVTFNDLVYKNTKIEKVNLGFGVKPSVIEISNLSLRSLDNYLDLEASLSAQELKPTFQVLVNKASLKADFLTPDLILYSLKSFNSGFDLTKALFKVSASNFNLSVGNYLYENIGFDLKNDEGLIDISNFGVDLWGGRLESACDLDISPLSFKCVYALNSIDFSQSPKLVPISLFDVGGFSVSGKITSAGEDFKTLFYELYSDSKFIAKDLVLQGISIDDFVYKIIDKNYDPKNLATDAKNASLTGQTSIESARGNLTLKNGIIKLDSLSFKTQNCTGVASGDFSFYDSSLEMESSFSFEPPSVLAKKSPYGYSASYRYAPKVDLLLKIKGSILQPEKDLNYDSLNNFLKLR